MGILEQVAGLKERGVSEDEIVKNLREQGISPNEISETLSQAKIKSAVSSEQRENSFKEGMEPSIMGVEGPEETRDSESLPTEHISDEDLNPPTPLEFQPKNNQRPHIGFKPMTKEVSEEGEEYPSERDYPPQPQEQMSASYQNQGQYYPPYQDYSPDYQQDYGYDYSGQGFESGGADTIIEISEQVFSEKIKNIQKQINEFNEFKSLAEVKINNISDRLKRIESNIDRLQAEILEKVGSYGRGLEGVKKEMGMVQESFGKIVNTLADKADEKEKYHSKHTKEESTKTKSKKTKKRE